MASSIQSIKVIRSEPELVKPSKQTPRELKLLSDIDDQEGLRFQVPVIFFYKNNNLGPYKDPISVIRQALARALVYYYPFAGRLREGLNRKLTVDCTAEGVLFVAAEADVEFDQLRDAIQPPCPFLDEFLARVPGSDGVIGCPLISMQVTRLKCGGFVLALNLNHTMADAFGLLQFLNTVAEMARGKHAPSIPPVWQRDIFNARTPPRITYPLHEFRHPNPPSKHPYMTIDPNNNVQKSFFFGPKQIQTLRDQVPPGQPCSRFDLITACLWKCRTVALNLNPDQTVKISCLFSIRGGGRDRELHVPRGYYGNAIVYPAAVTSAGALTAAPLGHVVALVRKAKVEAAESGGEYLRSVADLMGSRGRPIYAAEGNYIVSDNSRAGYREVDFGWGPAEFGGPAEALGLISFYVEYERERGEVGVAVPICLPSAVVMERFGREVRKMTGDDVREVRGNREEGCELIKGVRIVSSL